MGTRVNKQFMLHVEARLEKLRANVQTAGYTVQ